MKMSKKTRRIYDSSLEKGMPASSKFISSDEWVKLYPGGIRRSKNYIFDPTMPKTIPEKEALFLIKKYPELKIRDDKGNKVEIIDELDEMPSREMRQFAQRYYLTVAQKKDVDIISEIRERRQNGVKPMSEKVFKDHKYHGTMKQARDEWEANNIKE